MRFFTSDRFVIPLPDGHSFPGRKYILLRECLVRDGILKADQILPSPLAGDADIVRAHDAAYVATVREGRLDTQAQRRIGLPWSANLVDRVTATMGGAVAAAEAALDSGLSGQLAGGTHHAHRDFGAGYCVFNDFAIAALKVLAEGWGARVAIIDLDVHQGDGNAAILAGHPDVFVFSMQGEKNFPHQRVASDLDVDLPDGTEDEIYLRTLAEHLPAVFDFRPDLVLYQAGVDPLREDRLGRLALTLDGLARRDRLVLTECRSRGIPVSMAIGGGYADPIEVSVQAYVNTYAVAKEVYRF
ncbi:MAG: histone deacetylase [Rhodospirillales bacterium CG15_BIG_FIL_POST_REV_8_21_14_020_66_15]|nr:MAG: histone deacetylase [Rhodospirillales bacterium CG15_BIG_FIL_POST_REV_8_21_14_020_66_15]